LILERNAPAKVNLGLHVLRKRPDGYHDIETVFLRIPWFDRLTVRPADRLVFTCSDPALPKDASNLCVRAALRLMEAAKVNRGAAIHLEKSIPYGAGLGGGSSDAAATLALLNTFWAIDMETASLREIGAGLGSDVPFFMGDPVALGKGRGERLMPLNNHAGMPYRFPFTLVVVALSVAVSTADAYAGITPSGDGRPDLADVVGSNDLQRWRDLLINDFETSIFPAFPLIEDVKCALLERGAGYASMSGSGSAVFGVFEEEARANEAAGAFRREKLEVWVGNKALFSVV
jgi:4-diphosphocytidyl-2-C-methyl-D-erythritol kinase